MITESWVWNLANAFLLALIATLVLAEGRSTALVPKSLLLWPALVFLFGISSLFQNLFFGTLFILCAVQAVGVNLRKLQPWPSGMIWLGLIPIGLTMQLEPLFVKRIIGFLWVAISLTKLVRERSAALEGGTPIWILLLYAQAILLASYR